MINIADTAAFTAVIVLISVAFGVGFAVVAVILRKRRRFFVTGEHGMARVIHVYPTPMVNRRSLTERATEMVVVATNDLPQGSTPQKVPAGQYVVGQTVEVVRAAGRPASVKLNRPDLEYPAIVTWGFAAMAVIAPLIALRSILDGS